MFVEHSEAQSLVPLLSESKCKNFALKYNLISICTVSKQVISEPSGENLMMHESVARCWIINQAKHNLWKKFCEGRPFDARLADGLLFNLDVKDATGFGIRELVVDLFAVLQNISIFQVGVFTKITVLESIPAAHAEDSNGPNSGSVGKYVVLATPYFGSRY